MRLEKSILVVDAAPMFHDIAGLFLARTARVRHAQNGTDALQSLASAPADLVVADLHMPGMNGADFCRTLKRTPGREQVPVVMMVRDGSSQDRLQAVEAGADEMLCKPLVRDDLIQTVNRFLENGLDRKLPRLSVKLPVQLRNDLLHAHGTIYNISRGGLYLEAECELPLYSRVALEIPLSELERTISPIAEIVWQRPGRQPGTTGLGLRFTSLEGSALRSLVHFLELRRHALRTEVADPSRP
ncbi:MAG: response regulator [Myxococcota bacterium]